MTKVIDEAKEYSHEVDEINLFKNYSSIQNDGAYTVDIKFNFEDTSNFLGGKTTSLLWYKVRHYRARRTRTKHFNKDNDSSYEYEFLESESFFTKINAEIALSNYVNKKYKDCSSNKPFFYPYLKEYKLDYTLIDEYYLNVRKDDRIIYPFFSVTLKDRKYFIKIKQKVNSKYIDINILNDQHYSIKKFDKVDTDIIEMVFNEMNELKTKINDKNDVLIVDLIENNFSSDIDHVLLDDTHIPLVFIEKKINDVSFEFYLEFKISEMNVEFLFSINKKKRITLSKDQFYKYLENLFEKDKENIDFNLYSDYVYENMMNTSFSVYKEKIDFEKGSIIFVRRKKLGIVYYHSGVIIDSNSVFHIKKDGKKLNAVIDSIDLFLNKNDKYFVINNEFTVFSEEEFDKRVDRFKIKYRDFDYSVSSNNSEHFSFDLVSGLNINTQKIGEKNLFNILNIFYVLLD